MASPRAPFDLERVARVARDVIAEHGLALELIGISLECGDWHVTVRDARDSIVQFTIVETASAVALRTQLIWHLEAAAP